MSQRRTPPATVPRARWWVRAVPFALALCVGAAGIASLTAFHRAGDRAQVRLAEVTRMSSLADQLQGIQGRIAIETFNKVDTTRSFAIGNRLARQLQETTAAAFPGGERDLDPVAREISRDVTTLVPIGMRSLVLVHDKRFDAELQRLGAAVISTEDRLRVLLHRAAARQRHAAQAADQRAATGSILTVVAMFALLLGLGFGARQAEQRRERIRRNDIKARERWFRALIEQSNDMILVVDRDSIVRFAAPGGAAELGIARDNVVDRGLAELLCEQDVTRFTPLWSDLLERPGGTLRLDVTLPGISGEEMYIEAVCQNRLDDEVVGAVIVNARDVTGRRRLEQQLMRRAFRDELTGLPNRAEFLDRLDHALGGAHRLGDRVAVLFLDLDGFKTINDTLGHAAGDELLCVVAQRLRSVVRPSDTAARLAGDEFTVLLEEVVDEADALDVATRIEQELTQPVTITGQPITLGVSIGVAFGDAGERAADILRAADTAMYESKTARRGSIVMFEPEMVERAWSRLRAGTAVDRKLRRLA